MKAIGTMIKHMVRDNIFMQTELLIMVRGWRINSMGMELKLGQMVQSMKANILMERNMEKED